VSKAKAVYQYVREYLIENKGRSPSYDQIMEACDIASKSNVGTLLGVLVEAGLLEREDGARGLRLPNSKLVVEEDA
jgi:SOS-response transcriptional repressor LexA